MKKIGTVVPMMILVLAKEAGEIGLVGSADKEAGEIGLVGSADSVVGFLESEIIVVDAEGTGS